MNTVVTEALDRLAESGLKWVVQPTLSADTGTAITIMSSDEQKASFRVQLRPQLTPAAAGTIPGVIDALPALVVAPHVTESTGESLRTLGLAYVDAVGNASIRFGPVLIDIRGRKPRPGPTTKELPSRAFRASGLKVVLALLQDPASVTMTMHQIAALTGVADGTVHAAITDLERNGYLLRRNGKTTLLRQRRLLDEWSTAYALRLQPKLHLAAFRSPTPKWWRDPLLDITAIDGQWGAETAAELLGGELRATRAVLYTPVVPATWAAQLRWQSATPQDADVEIRKRFWTQLSGRRSTCPSVLVYADLLAAADSRLREAAQQLRGSDDRLERIDQS